MCECGYDRECKPKHFECSHYVKCLEKQLKRAEQKLEKIKQHIKDNEWCILDGTYKELLQIIEE